MTSLHAPSPACCAPKVPPRERAAARVRREAGVTVATKVLARNLNVAPCRQDDRCIEVITNGLPLSGGVQVAVDTTLASPLTASGGPPA